MCTTMTSTTDTTEPKAFTCSRCSADHFSSRNQLFAHLKICLADRNPTNSNRIPDAEYFDKQDAFIYVTGGRLRGKTLATVERFNCRTREWETKSSFKDNRGSHGSASVGDHLYVIGGGGFKSNLSSMERLDCKTGEWEQMAPTPSSRHALIALSVGRCIYAIGGWMYGTVCSMEMERYDVDSNTWTVCQQMPTGRRLLGAAEHCNHIYTFGGNIGEKEWNSNATEIYDIANDTWRKGPDLPVAGQASAASIGDFVFVVMHGHYVLRFCPSTVSFMQVSFALPNPRWFCFDVTVVNDSLYVVGGNIEGVWSSVLWKYDVFANTWEPLPSMTKERRRCSAALVTMPK